MEYRVSVTYANRKDATFSTQYESLAHDYYRAVSHNPSITQIDLSKKAGDSFQPMSPGDFTDRPVQI